MKKTHSFINVFCALALAVLVLPHSELSHDDHEHGSEHQSCELCIVKKHGLSADTVAVAADAIRTNFSTALAIPSARPSNPPVKYVYALRAPPAFV